MGRGKAYKNREFQAHLRFGNSILHPGGTIKAGLRKAASDQRESQDGKVSFEHIVCILNIGARVKWQGERKIHGGMFESGFVVVIDLKERRLYVKAHNWNHLFNGV